MNDNTDISGYGYEDGELNSSHGYLLPALQTELGRLDGDDKRLFDLGCGNGSIGAAVGREGWDVTGVDVSSDGIAYANRVHPELRLETGSAYEDLAGKYGTFPVVVSLEVVEHLYDPRTYALTGKMDHHFHALWDHGHIKFWSIPTLTELLREAGFETPRFERVGRISPLAKSMIAIARKPS